MIPPIRWNGRRKPPIPLATPKLVRPAERPARSADPGAAALREGVALDLLWVSTTSCRLATRRTIPMVRPITRGFIRYDCTKVSGITQTPHKYRLKRNIVSVYAVTMKGHYVWQGKPLLCGLVRRRQAQAQIVRDGTCGAGL
jgi:hypothetical protein